MRDSVVLTFISVVISFNAFCQTAIKGKVTDRETSEPISMASVRLASQREFSVTDEKGNFQLTSSGAIVSDTLIVTHIGYRVYMQPLLQADLSGELIVALERDVTTLNEVTVYSKFWRKQYSPEELREDYNKFCLIMEKTHTGLFEYLGEEQWRHLKDSSHQLFNLGMTHSEFYRLIALHVGKVRNKHTLHGVTDWWYKQKQNIFPFNVRYFGDRLYVNESLISELTISRGSEILMVNGRTPSDIKTMIAPFIPADGYNETGRVASINDFFPWYYSLFVEETKEYIIKLQDLDGNEKTITTSGLRDAFARLSFRQVQKWRKPSLELEIDNSLKAAYFRIEDSRVFKDSLAIYFQRISDNKVQHLIIDLRGSGGLRTEEGVAELYSYLISEPRRIYEPIQIKSNDHTLFDKDFSHKPYGKSVKHLREAFFDKLVLSEKGYYTYHAESYLELINPSTPTFKGQIYILTGGRNYSASTDFTSLAAQLDNVKIVGEETGGEYRSYISGAMFGLVLPNSKIGVKIPTWKSILVIDEIPSQRGRGVLPDFPVSESLEDFINARDMVKEYAYELIRKGG
jgi:hypothetical protein